MQKRETKYQESDLLQTVLDYVDLDNVDYLLGLFSFEHMDYHLEANPASQPTLREMTEAALKILNRNPKGYVLFVEGIILFGFVFIAFLLFIFVCYVCFKVDASTRHTTPIWHNWPWTKRWNLPRQLNSLVRRPARRTP
jgi:hypothetical protein